MPAEPNLPLRHNSPAPDQRAAKLGKVARWTLGICVVCAGVAITLWSLVRDPEVRLLMPERGAHWIRVDEPFELAGKGGVQQIVYFRTNIEVPQNSPRTAVLTLRAMRICAASWNGQEFYFPPQNRELWKQAHHVPLGSVLTPGRHELSITVENSYGPALLLAYCEELGIKTGPDWESHYADTAWKPSLYVTETVLPEVSRQFRSPAESLRSCLKWLVPLLIATWCVAAWGIRQASPTANNGAGQFNFPSLVRWLLMAGWVVLGANNFQKLPVDAGYDLPGHQDYVRYIAEGKGLPLASDGPQMFQAPLYYLLSAGFFRLLRLGLSEEAAWMWLRWIPLACWLGQIELIYRSGKVVFPRRPDLHCGLLLLGGLLPMGISMSQVMGNEPLCALLTAGTLLMCCQGLEDPAVLQSSRRHWWMGVCLGLAVLTKVSALLLVPVIAAVFFVALRKFGIATIVAGLARCSVAAIAVSGWYYFRNWVEFDKPIVGGWDPVSGILWWQDPGYRTPEQMLTFGWSLFWPIHAGFHSIWDGFYSTLWFDGNLSGMGSARPPWNFSWMLAAAWPALMLTIAAAAGALRSFRTGDTALRRSLCLGSSVLILYLVAFAYLCLRVPVYSQAKASYTLGLTPFYALLCVAGLDLLPKHWAVRSAVWAFVLCWSVLAYGAYFVVG